MPQFNFLDAIASITPQFLQDFFTNVSGNIMHNSRNAGIMETGNSFFKDFKFDKWKNYNQNEGEPEEGAAQITYLLPKIWQKNYFLSHGYQVGNEGDYGLVRKAVKNRKLPIYQKSSAYPIDRDELVVLGNFDDEDTMLGNPQMDDRLTHAGKYPTAMYVNPKDGTIFYKSWDLNDYGIDTAGKGRGYKYMGDKQKYANLVDLIGSPTVVTTGFQVGRNYQTGYPFKITDDTFQHAESDILRDKFLKEKGLQILDLGDSKKVLSIPEINITYSKHKLGGRLISNNPIQKFKNRNK